MGRAFSAAWLIAAILAASFGMRPASGMMAAVDATMAQADDGPFHELWRADRDGFAGWSLAGARLEE